MVKLHHGKSLIKRLPDEDDPQRSREERVAKDVVFIAYIGAWYTWAMANLSS
jgi:hypothetical protein